MFFVWHGTRVAEKGLFGSISSGFCRKDLENLISAMGDRPRAAQLEALHRHLVILPTCDDR